jgi:uncharacterized protein YkwD
MKVFSIYFALVMLFNIELYATETELFKLLNIYRAANKAKPIVWSETINNISAEQLNVMVEFDSLFHSGKNTYECVTRGFNIASRFETKDEFNAFCIKYFKTPYDPYDPNINLKKLMNMYIMFSFHKSPKHKAILLRTDVTIGSAQSINVEDFEFVVTCRKIPGVTTTCQTLLTDNYKTKYFGIVNLR